MTHYRITYEDKSGHLVVGSEFDAKDDHEAPHRGRALLPAQTSGYEIWRDEGSSRGQLVFAEWQLIRGSETE
jgi:hypothetical protein